MDKKRQVVLNKLLPFTKDYVLSGGTALALQLSHRKSFDFDFFSTSLIPKNLPEKLSGALPINNIAVDSAEEFTFFTTGSIKITFLYYPFGHLFPIETLANGLKLFGIKDIAIKRPIQSGEEENTEITLIFIRY